MQELCPMQGILPSAGILAASGILSDAGILSNAGILADAGILPIEFNGARKAPPANEALWLSRHWGQQGEADAEL